MIAVCIATYNHEHFISQCISSVLAQQCEEQLRIYIGDDASTDRTRELCEQYAETDPRIVYIRREQNMGLVPNTIDLYRRILADQCEFIAMLDGDDYWTDPRKLQLQLDYMHSHPEVGLVHTAAYDDSDGQLLDNDSPDKPIGDLSRSYDLSGAKQTNCTVLFRTDLLHDTDLTDLEAQHFPVLDYPLYGIFSQYTSFGYIHTYTAAWRCHSSVSNPARFSHQLSYLNQRIRIWRWLDRRYSGHFHFRWYKAIFRYNMRFFYFLFAYLKKKL